MRDDDRHVGGHARLEFQVRIRDVDDGDVRDDVLVGLRRVADLRHLALEGLTWKGIHGELDVLAHSNLADVRLCNVGFDLHPGQVVGDDEQSRRAEAGGDGLANVDVP